MAIDINIPSQVAQTITNGVTGTAPSQDAVFDALALKESLSNKGLANGYVPLNASTKVDSSYLPSYVDDVIEVANFAALPVTGETGKIYITIDTGLIYRWSGSIYVQIGGQDPVWGAITGTLSNQTDLQNALNAKLNDPLGTSSQYIKGNGTLGTSVSGTVTSVGLTMPSAFTVASSPITSSGTIAVTGAGLASQYVRGDGQLATFPTTGGGGSSVYYYLNGSINASVIGYKQLDNTAIIGAGTDFNLTGNGLIAQFLTNVANPNRNLIPGGAWNFEMFFSMSSNGGNTKFYVELLKYNGTIFTSIASTIAIPEQITGGIAIDLYLTSLAVPETVLLTTDSLAVRVYVVDNSGGRTVTLHTEDNHLCQIITTFAGGISSLNGLNTNTQYLATATTGTDFNISSVTDTHTFNLPVASATNTGKLSSGNWITFNGKQDLLVSSVNIQTINGNSILGSGNIVTTYIRRHETTATYDYLGFAPTGTAESTATWTLTRLTLSNTGTSAVMHATDSWNNRVTATYI
jgi:hypothetical protein